MSIICNEDNEAETLTLQATNWFVRLRHFLSVSHYRTICLIVVGILMAVIVSQGDGSGSSGSSFVTDGGESGELSGRIVPSQVPTSLSSSQTFEVTLTNTGTVPIAHGGYAALLGPDGEAIALLRVMGGRQDLITLDPARGDEIPRPAVLGRVAVSQSTTTVVKLPQLEPGSYEITLSFTQSPDGAVGNLDEQLVIGLSVET